MELELTWRYSDSDGQKPEYKPVFELHTGMIEKTQPGSETKNTFMKLSLKLLLTSAKLQRNSMIWPRNSDISVNEFG
jgi:hypothetical protein